MISQITYCAARLKQDPESLVVFLTAEYLLEELSTMTQWTSDFRDSAPGVPGYPMMTWIRTLPRGYIIHSAKEMTEVTAEAWRLAAMLYLQCRLLRHMSVPSLKSLMLNNAPGCLAMMLRLSPTWTPWPQSYASCQQLVYTLQRRRPSSQFFCLECWRLSAVSELWR